MRTTITLDDDIAVVVERLRRERKLPLKAVVNEALREGLRQMQAPPTRRTPFVTCAADLGACRLGNVDNVGEVLAVAESDSFA